MVNPISTSKTSSSKVCSLLKYFPFKNKQKKATLETFRKQGYFHKACQLIEIIHILLITGLPSTRITLKWNLNLLFQVLKLQQY